MGDYDSYGNALFGDKRLSKRLPTILEQLSSDTTASISAACGDPYQAKAIYRFLANEGTTVERIVQVAHDVTIGNIYTVRPAVLLLVQDTVEINYSGLKMTGGLGNIGTKKSSLGILGHTSLAIGEDGEVFGMMAQKLWTRPPEEHGKSKSRKNLPIEEKESYKWLETMMNAEAAFPEGTLAVHVCDREGDIYELFQLAEEKGAHYLCRRTYNRLTESDDGNIKLDDFLAGRPVAGTATVNVPRDSHTGRLAREAALEIRYGKCLVKKPRTSGKDVGLPKTVEVYAISAVEINPPEGQEGISWQLVTNVPAGSFDDAVRMLHWYTLRWRIELFHKTLKSGCTVEELQSVSAERLMKLIAVYSIIALQIMSLSYVARTNPDKSCEKYFEKDEWKILYKVANKTKDLPETPPTILEAVVMVAKLGGFLARKSDGFPGVKVMWKGLTKFYTILDAAAFLA